MVKINTIHFSQDGTVKILLSDKRTFRLRTQSWIDLNYTRDEALSEYKIEALESESYYTKIREKILRLLASREHSVFELQTKIKQGFFKSRIKNFTSLFNLCIQEMQEKDFQNDERFARHFVNSRIENKIEGPYKILQDLQNRGIQTELAESVIKVVSNNEIWIRKTIECIEYFQKKNKNLSKESCCQKLFRRGFPWEIIQKAFEEYKI